MKQKKSVDINLSKVVSEMHEHIHFLSEIWPSCVSPGDEEGENLPLGAYRDSHTGTQRSK